MKLSNLLLVPLVVDWCVAAVTTEDASRLRRAKIAYLEVKQSLSTKRSNAVMSMSFFGLTVDDYWKLIHAPAPALGEYVFQIAKADTEAFCGELKDIQRGVDEYHEALGRLEWTEEKIICAMTLRETMQPSEIEYVPGCKTFWPLYLENLRRVCFESEYNLVFHHTAQLITVLSYYSSLINKTVGQTSDECLSDLFQCQIRVMAQFKDLDKSLEPNSCAALYAEESCLQFKFETGCFRNVPEIMNIYAELVRLSETCGNGADGSLELDHALKPVLDVLPKDLVTVKYSEEVKPHDYDTDEGKSSRPTDYFNFQEEASMVGNEIYAAIWIDQESTTRMLSPGLWQAALSLLITFALISYCCLF